MKAVVVVAAFNQEKALVGAFSVITNLRMELFEALVYMHYAVLYNVHMDGSRSDLSAAHASNYDNNKCTLFMGNYRNDGPLMLPYISWHDLPLFAGPRIMFNIFFDKE